MKTPLIITVAYALIFAPSCKTTSSHTKEVDPQSWVKKIPNYDTATLTKVQNVTLELSQMIGLGIPAVVHNSTDNTLRKATRNEIQGIDKIPSSSQIYLGSTKSRFLYSVKPTNDFYASAKKGKMNLLLIEHDRALNYRKSNGSLLTFDLADTAGDQEKFRQMIIAQMQKLKSTIKKETIQDAFEENMQSQYESLKRELKDKENALSELEKSDGKFISATWQDSQLFGNANEWQVGPDGDPKMKTNNAIGMGVAISMYYALILLFAIPLAFVGAVIAERVVQVYTRLPNFAATIGVAAGVGLLVYVSAKYFKAMHKAYQNAKKHHQIAPAYYKIRKQYIQRIQVLEKELEDITRIYDLKSTM